MKVAQANPNRDAIRFGGEAISYERLHQISDCIAGQLRQKITAEMYIPALFDRSPRMVATMLGILKAGGIFVPMTPFLPENRIKRMLDELKPALLITSTDHLNMLSGILEGMVDPPEIVEYEDISTGTELLESIVPMDNKHCYVYFTSGSTGVPKGILGRTISLAHFIQWEIGEFAIDESFKVSQLTPPTFDPFLRDIFVPLSCGGTCCIPQPAVLRDMDKLIQWLDEEEVNLIHMVPSLFKEMTGHLSASSQLKHVKYILLAGELLRGNDIRRFIELFDDRIQLVNLYGPTETTMVKFFYRIQPEDKDKPVVAVGKPIQGSQALLLNSRMQRCEPGQRGEIYIRTPFMTSGYFNDRQMTEQVFIPNPFSANPMDIVYKTGDLGRMLPCGNLEISGRTDGQVKIRGTRIEPGEIENQLLRFPAITEAVVLATEDDTGEKHLCAYITAGEDSLDSREIRKFLSAELPSYMVPTYFIQLDNMPLNINGKVDRALLPAPRAEKNSNHVPPGDEVERVLVKIWSEVLEIPEEKIGIEDEFFQLGGHSLKANQVIARISNRLDVEITLAEIFSKPTIRELAIVIRGRNQQQAIMIPRAPQKESYPLSSAQQRLYIIQQMEDDSVAYNIYMNVLLEGDFDAQRFQEIFRILIQRHESLRTSFHMEGDSPVQKIHSHVEFNIDWFYPEGSPDPVIRQYIRPFDLERPPLIRAALIKTGERKHIMVIDTHHIISDVMTQNNIFREFLQLYKGLELPELPLQYKDYSEWQNSEAYRELIQKQEDFWLNEYREAPSLLDYPYDYAPLAKPGNKGSFVELRFDTNERELVLKLAANEGGTIHIVMLAVFYVLLARLSGKNDISVGIPVVGRINKELEPVAGVFINTIALRNFPTPGKTFRDFLREVVNRSFKAYENQAYPFENLVNKVWKHRGSNRNPLFDTIFEVRNQDVNTFENEAMNLEGLDISYYKIFQETTKIDMDWMGFETNKGMAFMIIYATDLYKRRTIEIIAEKYKSLVKSVIENCDRPIGDLDSGPQLPVRKTIQEQGDFQFDL